MIKTIRIAGFGGQGVMLLGELLAYSATLKGLNTVFVPTYGPETRGGTANCMVTISDGPIYSPVFNLSDDLIVLNEPSYLKFKNTIKDNGYLIYNSSLISTLEKASYEIKPVRATELARELEEPKVMNIVLLGTYLNHLKLFDHETILLALKHFFGEKKVHLLPINQKALEIGVKQ
ncbi:MAG: 2-oxoacid:acceptor oxidoreductase family protein [Firmicutes bacterium]|nr:2-oxoacid:acceptor oxidoreductase family protein [Bacillota bacterium]